MPHSAAGWLSAGVCLIVVLYAWSRGAIPERVAGAALLLNMLAAAVGQDRALWFDPERRLLAIDGALFVVLACLVSTTRRRWLIVATALQMLLTVLHFTMLYRHDARSFAYLNVVAVLSYGVMAALGWGTWTVDRSRAREERIAAEEEADRLIALYGVEEAYVGAAPCWRTRPVGGVHLWTERCSRSKPAANVLSAGTHRRAGFLPIPQATTSDDRKV